VTQDAGQHSLHLQHSELLSYAVPRAGAEGDLGVGVPLCCTLWQEVVRVDLLRVRELIRVPMVQVNMDCNRAACRYCVATWKRTQTPR
jgi:hypothetical protein